MIELKPGLVVGLPVRERKCDSTEGLIQPQVAFSWSQFIFPLNTAVAWAPCQGFKRDDARNATAEETIKLGAPYLWFLDDDVQVPSKGPLCLLETMRQADDDVAVVAGVYTGKCDPAEPLVYRGGNGLGAFWKWKAGDIFECDAIATGCMLIKTEVFKHIEKPWFRDVDNEIEGWTVPNKGEGAVLRMTDDIWFCEKIRAAGYKILCDSRVICRHWDVPNNKCYGLAEDSYPMRPREKWEGTRVERTGLDDQSAHETSA